MSGSSCPGVAAGPAKSAAAIHSCSRFWATQVRTNHTSLLMCTSTCSSALWTPTLRAQLISQVSRCVLRCITDVAKMSRAPQSSSIANSILEEVNVLLSGEPGYWAASDAEFAELIWTGMSQGGPKVCCTTGQGHFRQCWAGTAPTARKVQDLSSVNKLSSNCIHCVVKCT